MYNRRYEKIFIMLRQEQAGFGIGHRAPWGSCILELKNGLGYLTIQVQGLQCQEGYQVYLLGGLGCKQKDFLCGTLLVEENGRGTLSWTFSPETIEVGGMVLEDIHTVAILVEQKENILVPMCGYIGDAVQWKQEFLNQRKQPIAKQVEQPVIEEVIMEETTLQAAEAVVQMQNPDYHGNFRGLLSKFKAELAELQEAGIFSTKEMEQIERAGKVQKTEEVLESVAEEEMSEPEITPEIPEEEPVPEVQYIGLEEAILLEGVPLSWRNELFFLLAMKKYGGFLWYPDEWLLGVPAKLEDEDMAHFFGFTYFWQPENQDFGYWMMELEMNTQEMA
ncbi:hypothetical protein [Chakrabartyella piscis]|uniref:hypothetical protein n=1 Tax=Chakrabartyella piscis TaxID=2918914 RepID=UPI0029585A48|nr:hypothetical protein [Chakrabartyella piscis]